MRAQRFTEEGGGGRGEGRLSSHADNIDAALDLTVGEVSKADGHKVCGQLYLRSELGPLAIKCRSLSAVAVRPQFSWGRQTQRSWGANAGTSRERHCREPAVPSGELVQDRAGGSDGGEHVGTGVHPPWLWGVTGTAWGRVRSGLRGGEQR